MLNMKMTGQAAIVTGAARGFGLAISSRLMECGVRVIGWNSDPSPIAEDDRFLHVEKIDITCPDTVYAATESGLAKELALFGITANCITPSLVETDLLKEMSDDHIAGIRTKTLMGRLCKVNEVADMVAWVASPACSYSTGACFDVSGGRAQF